MNDVQTFLVDLREELDRRSYYEGLLSEFERVRADQFKFERDHNRYVLTHGVLRERLSRYLACSPQDISIEQEARGKPYLAGRELEFNLSHSGDYALFAFSRVSPVGVDIECLDRCADSDVAAIARRFFSPKEYEALMALPEQDRQRAFFHVWTCKEAVVKALGQGIADALDQFIVSVDPRKDAQLIDISTEISKKKEWVLNTLSAPPGYCAALAFHR